VQRKSGIFSYIIGYLIIGICTGCATGRGTTTTWEDATIIAKQQLIIDQQQRTLSDMGDSIGEIRQGLGDARSNIERSLAENTDIRSQWGEIKRFVKSVLDAERGLEELQQSNRPADAEERRMERRTSE
jgi:hypothetical protein